MSARTLFITQRALPTSFSSRSILSHQCRNATVNGIISPADATRFLAEAPKSRRGNTIAIPKIYLYHLYREIVSRRSTFFIQINNMTSKEYKLLRLDLKKQGFGACLIRNSVYKAALRDDTTEASGLSEPDVDKLKHMFVGPTCVVSSPDTAMDAVALLDSFVQTVVKGRNPRKFLILGGKLDRMVLSADEIASVRKEYPMGVTGLREQLVSMLDSAGGRNLVDNLERSGGQDLTSALEARGMQGDEQAGE
jgi:ribosomal protein L10